MPQANDEDLLNRIAASHDRDAFNLIFSRYGTVALNLAQHMIGNRATAEEAVQEAMLSVWQKSGGFDPGRGSAKTWIMRVVAHKALQLARKSQRSRRREVAAGKNAEQDHAARESHLRNREDLVTVVREKFAELPEALRQILALYFAGNMSQEELSKVLIIPQTTVSMRIRQGIDELRTRLKGAGYALALPMVTAESLGELLRASPEIPADISARILQAIGSAARHSARAAATTIVGVSYWVGGAALLSMSAAGAWVAMEREPDQRPAEVKTPAAPVQPAPAPQAPAKPGYFLKTWDFNTPESAKDFKVTLGSWRFVPNGGQDGSGCMEITSEKFRAYIQVPELHLPLVVTYATASPEANETLSGVGMAGTLMTAAFENIADPATINEYIGMKQYLSEEFNLGWCNGRLAGLIFYMLREENELIFNAVGHQYIDNVEIHTAEPGEAPDVKKYRDALRGIPASQRQGTVALPQLTSPKPGRTVTVTFRYYDDAAKPEAWGE
ncbi:MAG: RNA polymerase sigma factor [Planctomycetes bacterium]|nr:RNA polymerase sigma factor [Planctomycetota bacterium]